MRIIFTNGCFDILHKGHVELLKFCKSMGHVVVGLNSDTSVKKLKGFCRPISTQHDRKFMLESCKFVDEVVIFEEETPYDLIKRIKPDIVVKGGDYTEKQVVGNDIAEVKIFNYIEGYSTTSIIKSRKMNFEKKRSLNSKSGGKTYVFDIDGTICANTYGKYEEAKPFLKRVEKINKLYDEGNTIVLFTARGMGRTEGNSKEAIRMYFDMTLSQTKDWGVKFHRLTLGKPSADYYIDDKGINDEDFFRD